jgi:hypothetical protein
MPMNPMRFSVHAVMVLLCFGATAAVAQTANPAPPAPTADAAKPVDACLGLTAQDPCIAVSACAWLPGYPVPGGTDIPGTCRTKPKPLTARRVPTPETSKP